MLYEFEPVHNTAEATKSICCAKGDSTDDHNPATRWLKKFCSGYMKVSQARSVRPKNGDSEVVYQVIKTNLASSARRVSGELGISQFSMVVTYTTKANTYITKIEENL